MTARRLISDPCHSLPKGGVTQRGSGGSSKVTAICWRGSRRVASARRRRARSSAGVSAPVSERGQRRRASTTFTSAATSSDVGGEEEPREQADHEREDAVGGVGAGDRVVDVPAAQRLQDEQPGGGERDAGQQGAEARPLRRQQCEDRQEDHGVDGERAEDREGALGDGVDAAARGEAGRDGGRDERDAEDGQGEQPARPRLQATRLVHARHVPDLREGALEGDRDAEAGPQRAGEADHQGDAAPGERLDVVAQLGADDRDPVERRVDDVVAQRRVALEDEPEDRDEREQQREQREERVVGAQRGEARGPVLAELLRHGDGEPADGVPPLPGVDPRDDPPHARRRYPPPPPPPRVSVSWWRFSARRAVLELLQQRHRRLPSTGGDDPTPVAGVRSIRRQRMITGVPTGIRRARARMSALRIRMQPWETRPGTRSGRSVPWMPTNPPAGQSVAPGERALVPNATGP